MFTKEYRGYPCAIMWAAEQRITDLLRVGVYKANNYRDFMVYIYIYEQLLHITYGAANPSYSFHCTRTLTTELEVLWSLVPYFIPPIARIRGIKLSR